MIDSPSDCPFVTSLLCSTPVTVQLIIIDLLHSLFIVLEVLVCYISAERSVLDVSGAVVGPLTRVGQRRATKVSQLG